MGQAAYAWARSLFDADAMVRKYEELHLRMVNGHDYYRRPGDRT